MAEFGTLKVGDICRVVDNNNLHGFKIGEEILLDSLFSSIPYGRGKGFSAKRLDGTSCYRNVVREIDLEKVENMEKMKEFTKSDLKELDIVVMRNAERYVYFQEDFRSQLGCCFLTNYYVHLLRLDKQNEYDIMQVIRNNEVIWERIEKSPLQIELESLEQQQREIADKLAELRKKV